MKTAIGCAGLSLALALTAQGAALAQSADEVAKARDEILAKEHAIYAARGHGELGVYIGFVANNYLTWPPITALPINKATLEKDSGRMRGKTQEKSTLDLVDFTLNGSTAVIYYNNHLTMSADGKPEDLAYQNIHVWVREGGQWRLLAGMSRNPPALPPK